MSISNRVITKINNIVSEYRNTSKLANIIRQASSGNIEPNILFRDTDNDYWFWLNTTGYRKNPELRNVLPGLPEESVQLHFTGSSGDRTLKEGFKAYKLFKNIYENNAGSLSNSNNILDFGCGWGRTIRFFMKDIEPSKIWGIDANPDLIEECKKSNPWCNFSVSNTTPPTSFTENMFDLIYCYSVFSHLSEETHKKWIDEFSRILRPGGILIATTWQREYIQRCEEVRKMDEIPHWLTTPASAFLDTEKALSDYDNGNFCFSPVGKGDWSFFGEACISKLYVTNHWTEYFKFIDFIDDRRKCPQNVIVVMKEKN